LFYFIWAQTLSPARTKIELFLCLLLKYQSPQNKRNATIDMPTTNKEGMLIDQKPADVESLDKSDDLYWDHSEETSESNVAASSGAKANGLDEHSVIAREEHSAVTWLREIVFGVLLLAGVLVCIVVYHILASSQYEAFETYYDGAAAAVIQVRAVQYEYPRSQICAYSTTSGDLISSERCSTSGVP
jgi:hypothetical protein